MEVPKGLQALPKQVVSLLTDVGKIADGMGTLPKMLHALEDIQERVVVLEREVVEMHEAVERLDGKVDDLSRTLHPMRRAFTRRPKADANDSTEPTEPTEPG